MPTPTELHLTELACSTFLKLWSYPNPFRTKGKEFADLLVVFGNDILVFSDKASGYQTGDPTIAWRRWYQRTVTESIKQLKGAVRQLTDPDATIYVDAGASTALPFALPPVQDRRLHLIGVVHPDKLPGREPMEFQGFTFDGTVKGDEAAFRVGAAHLGSRLVHLFEGKSLHLLLRELDTVADFVEYLRHREMVIGTQPTLQFSEPDLLAVALGTRGAYGWPRVELPPADGAGVIAVPPGSWEIYSGSVTTERRWHENQVSYIIDGLIEHFHEEYISERYLQPETPTYSSHEHALRQLAGESRFGRRVIASTLSEVLYEPNQATFWAVTVESRDRPGTRYVWLTYPPIPQDVSIDVAEQFILNHLIEHVFAARGIFVASLVIGIAIPNPTAQAESYFITILDGTIWGSDHQALADELKREKGIFSTLQELHRHHFP